MSSNKGSCKPFVVPSQPDASDAAGSLSTQTTPQHLPTPTLRIDSGSNLKGEERELNFLAKRLQWNIEQGIEPAFVIESDEVVRIRRMEADLQTADETDQPGLEARVWCDQALHELKGKEEKLERAIRLVMGNEHIQAMWGVFYDQAIASFLKGMVSTVWLRVDPKSSHVKWESITRYDVWRETEPRMRTVFLLSEEVNSHLRAAMFLPPEKRHWHNSDVFAQHKEMVMFDYPWSVALLPSTILPGNVLPPVADRVLEYLGVSNQSQPVDQLLDIQSWKFGFA